jgi:hypothetical protein
MATVQDRINGLIGELGIKAPVLVATTAAITLSGTQTIDGVAVAEEDRVLVKNQADTTTNGIYYCQASTWVRAPDFDGVRDCIQGTLVFVVSGTTNGGTLWKLTTTDPVIGTSNLTFSVAASLTPSTFIQTLLDDATAATARSTLGAVGLTGNETIAGNKTFSGSITPSQTLGIVGTTTNNDANVGAVGEVISSTVPQGSAVSLVTNTDKNVTSISLTAGDWDIWGNINLDTAASTSITAFTGSSSTVSNTRQSPSFTFRCAAFVPGVVTTGQAVPQTRLSLSATTTIYLVAQATFTVSTAAAWGQIFARRRR